jgi:hypothetical protein
MFNFDFLYKVSSKIFLILRRIQQDIIINVTSSNIFHENPSSGSRGQPDRQTVRQTDMTKIIVAFLNFGKTPKY